MRALKVALAAVLLGALAVWDSAAAAPTLVECDGCVAVTSEVCRAVFKDKQRLPPGVVAAETFGGLCEIDNLRYYTNPPPVLLPACKKFLAARQEDLEAYFEEATRESLGDSCRDAVKTICGPTCGEKYKAAPVTQGGLRTIEYRDPNAKAGDDSIPRSFMPKAEQPKKNKKAKAKKKPAKKGSASSEEL